MVEITNNQNETLNHMNMADNEPKQDEYHHKIISTKLSRKKTSRSFKLRSETLDSLRLRRVFDLFDKNGDGVISLDEIKQALVLLGLDDDADSDARADADDHELKAIVSDFIRPGNKGLAFEDFQALHNSLNTNLILRDLHPNEVYDEEDQVESDLTEAFKVFDSDGDGFISASELQQVLSKLGFPEAQQELQHIQLMISSFDHNHDGLVDFVEFKVMMSRSLLLPSN
ncbi:probable calcium-binding protein CML43 [Amaranthus tricolor]|uniref:probable calcium-binding protein CML43 n=1 Tax=Amaranthus tricolor TaxID=29722 RepID=UPI00258A516A|nr:probable calcium-binding protein CML43 [Amaranthus tricolor]